MILWHQEPLLNLAFDPIMELLFTIENSEMESWDTDGEVSEEFWQSAQMPLSTALSLAQQGTELLLKGKIAEISPFLLISGNPNSWPKGCDKQDTPFVDFRTIDAQDLIRVHNSVAEPRLSEEFIFKFENLRRIRNKIMHSVDKSFKTSQEAVINTIIETFSTLVKPYGWLMARRGYLESHPNAVAYSTDYVEEVLSREMSHIIEILNSSTIKRFFHFNPKQRRYQCPDCYGDFSDYIKNSKFAQLRPNEPSSTKVYCIICNEERDVLRKKCIDPACKSNVIDAEENICLICRTEQD